MDFDKLLKPYSKPLHKGWTEVTPELLRTELSKKGHPPEIVDAAMEVVFARMERGKTFEDARALGLYLQREADKQHRARQRALLKVQQANLRKVMEASPATRVVDMLCWITLGCAIGGSVVYFWLQ